MLIQLKRIRKSLIKEGKLARYLAYAIGEIVLVVVGILIALQVNQWNLEKTKRLLEHRYYQNMKTQLTADKKELIGNINYSNLYLKQYREAEQIISAQDKTQIDTVGKISLNLLKFSDFRQKSTVYQTLVNTGDVKYISNHKILEKIEELEIIYAYIERLEQTHVNVTLNNALPEVVIMVQISPFRVKKPEMMYDFPFHNIFLLYIGLIEEKNGVYKDAIRQIDNVIDILDRELERFE